jgi:hypothetical protein
MLTSQGKGGHRDIKGFVDMVSQWARVRQLSLDNRVKEMDMLDHYGYWKSRGRSDPVIAKKWTKATKASKFRKKTAFMQGKKMMVWQKLQREIKNSDLLTASLSSGKETLQASKSAAHEMLTADKGISFHSSAKACFGGAANIVDDAGSSDSESSLEAIEAPATEKGKDDDGKPKKKKKKKASSSSDSDDDDDSDDEDLEGTGMNTYKYLDDG